jgi:transcriptional regulator with XRE-family HTH domain
MKFRHALGEVIRETRQDLKLTMRDVSSRGSMALSYLSEVEQGRKEASSEILECISLGLGVPLSKLIEQAAIRIRIHEPIDVRDFQFDELGLVV